MAKGVYIVMTHSYTVGEEEDKWDVYERCEFVDALKKRHHQEATVILDFLNETILKERIPNTYSYHGYVRHVTEKYPTQMAELKNEYKTSL